MSFDVGDTIEGLPSRRNGMRELFLGHASSSVPANIRPLGGGVPLLANCRRRAKLQRSGRLGTWVADEQNQLTGILLTYRSNPEPGFCYSASYSIDLVGYIYVDSSALLHRYGYKVFHATSPPPRCSVEAARAAAALLCRRPRLPRPRASPHPLREGEAW